MGTFFVAPVVGGGTDDPCNSHHSLSDPNKRFSAEMGTKKHMDLYGKCIEMRSIKKNQPEWSIFFHAALKVPISIHFMTQGVFM